MPSEKLSLRCDKIDLTVTKNLRRAIVACYYIWSNLQESVRFYYQEWRDAYEEYGHWIPAVWKYQNQLDWIGENWEFFDQRIENKVINKMIKQGWIKRKELKEFGLG